MYVRTYVRTYVRMYVCMYHACLPACLPARLSVFLSVCLYVSQASVMYVSVCFCCVRACEHLYMLMCLLSYANMYVGKYVSRALAQC